LSIPYTIIFTLAAVLVLVGIFGVAYKVKGLKTALFTVLVAFVSLGMIFILTIYAITGAMG
jgi:hypothetical protein